MPAPAAYFVVAGIATVVTGYTFYRFVYEPHIAPVLERLAEDFLERRRAARARHLAAPVDAARPPPDGDGPNDIPLNERRRRTRSSTSDEGGDEESAPLLGPQGSTTAREEPNLNEDVNVIRRRFVPAVPVVGHELSASPLGAPGSVNEHVISTATLPRRPVALANNNNRSGSEQVAAVPSQNNQLRTASVLPSPSPTGVSPSDVNEWRRTVALSHEDRRRQGQPMRPAVDRRPPPSPSTVPVPVPPFVYPTGYPLLDEPNNTLPQTPIYPTHVITDSSVPSTPSSTMSGGRNIMVTPPPRLSPLRSSTISTNQGASGANPSEISDLDPWNGVYSSLATQDGGFVPGLTQSTTSASFQIDESGDSSSTSQLLVPPPNASGAGPPPQLPPFSPLSSMHASTRSAHPNQPTSAKSPQLPTLQSPPPQTPPYLLTPSAQHPHHVHYPAPPNIAAVASSSPTTRGATAAATTPAVPTQAQPPISSILSLSQSYPISLDQEQGIEVVSNPTPSASPFQSPTFSDPFDLVGSPGPFGSPGSQGSIRPSPQSPFIPLSIPPLPISPPLPPSAGGNGTQRRQPLDLLGSASSVTATVRLNPPPQSPSTSTSMFYSFTNDGSTATTRRTSPPARPPPAVQSGGMLSFPPEANHNQQQQQQQKFASPGVMSPMLSELDFVSEFGGSELGSNDDIGSDSSWSSARF